MGSCDNSCASTLGIFKMCFFLKNNRYNKKGYFYNNEIIYKNVYYYKIKELIVYTYFSFINKTT